MITTSQHSKYLHNCKHLTTLSGSSNAKRRRLKKIHTKANGLCMWCGEKTFLWWEIDKDEFLIWSPLRQATFEHIVPRSMGGNNLDVNGGCACDECNTYRKNISYNSFKYLTANKDRYMKWKNNRPVSRKIDKRFFSNIRQYIIGGRVNRNIIQLATLMYMSINYGRVNLYQQFNYNGLIIRYIGEQYGVF